MKTLTALLLITTALTVSACNTLSGVGQDIKAGGSAIERAADKAK